MPAKILVLEDDADIANLIESTLKGVGHEVVKAPNVSRAMTVVRQEDISAAIVDLMMPIVDGYQFCTWARRRSKTANLPIIIVTAHEERYGRERAEGLGIKYFIPKPFEVQDLLKAVAQALREV